MKCATHNQDATAICAYCGRALCPSCSRVETSQQTACSDACAQGLSRTELAITSILKKHLQGARAAAYFSYALGAITLGTAIYGYRVVPTMHLANLSSTVLGVAVIAFGVWFHRMAMKKS